MKSINCQLQKLLVLTAILISLGCNKQQEQTKVEKSETTSISAPAKSGSGLGVVTKIATTRKFITIDHTDIPGIMEAMAMEYPVQTPEIVKDIHEQDSVEFTLTKTPESQYMVTEIHKK